MCGLFAAWSLVFATVTAVIGKRLTSKQWEYLFSAPGREWFYVAFFATGGILTLTGLAAGSRSRRVRRLRAVPGVATLISWRYETTAIGLGVTGTACFIITVFYLGGPFIQKDLLTNGWLPWLFIGAMFYLMSALNASSIEGR